MIIPRNSQLSLKPGDKTKTIKTEIWKCTEVEIHMFGSQGESRWGRCFCTVGKSLSPFWVPISDGEGPHLVPISLKIGSPLDPHVASVQVGRMLVHRGEKFVTLRDTNSPDWPLCNHPAPIIHLNNFVLDTLTLLIFTSFHLLLATPFD